MTSQHHITAWRHHRRLLPLKVTPNEREKSRFMARSHDSWQIATVVLITHAMPPAASPSHHHDKTSRLIYHSTSRLMPPVKSHHSITSQHHVTASHHYTIRGLVTIIDQVSGRVYQEEVYSARSWARNFLIQIYDRHPKSEPNNQTLTTGMSNAALTVP